MTEAIQSDRNSGSPSGAQGETEGFAAIGATTGMLIISAISLFWWSAGRPRPATSLPDPSTSLRAGSRGARPHTNYERLATNDQRRTPKRPLPPPPRSHTINNNADYQNHRRIPYLPQKAGARNQHENEAPRRY